MYKFLKRKYIILNLWLWDTLSVKRNRLHWDLDRTNRYRYGWESNTMRIHNKLHKRFDLCVQIFGNEADNYCI
jgi:hypothetical protein